MMDAFRYSMSSFALNEDVYEPASRVSKIGRDI